MIGRREAEAEGIPVPEPSRGAWREVDAGPYVQIGVAGRGRAVLEESAEVHIGPDCLDINHKRAGGVVAVDGKDAAAGVHPLGHLVQKRRFKLLARRETDMAQYDETRPIRNRVTNGAPVGKAIRARFNDVEFESVDFLPAPECVEYGRKLVSRSQDVLASQIELTAGEKRLHDGVNIRLQDARAFRRVQQWRDKAITEIFGQAPPSDGFAGVRQPVVRDLVPGVDAERSEEHTSEL